LKRVLGKKNSYLFQISKQQGGDFLIRKGGHVSGKMGKQEKTAIGLERFSRIGARR